MKQPPPTVPIHQLMQHREWVRQLARRLVRDESRVDDLEQQTWMAAIRKPPTGNQPKAWLGQVVRNLAVRMHRGGARVQRREQAAARSEGLRSTSELAAQVEMHKRVVQAVLDLDAPYRDTLLLRHYEGWPPRRVAERMGISVETVRSRTRRGLEKIRSDFDREHGGDGKSWRLALTPLLSSGWGSGTAASLLGTTTKATGTAATGALFMSTQTNLALVVVALLALGAWFVLGDAEEASPIDPTPVVEGEDGEKHGAKLLAEGAAPEEELVVAEVDPSEAPPPPMPPGAGWVRVARGTKEQHAGVGSAYVRFSVPSGTTYDIETDDWGRADFPKEAFAERGTIWVIDPDGGLLARERATLAEGERLVLVPEPKTVELRLVDAHGNALTAEEVERRYSEAGARPIAHLISYDVLADGDRSVLLENLLGLSENLSQRTGLRFEDGKVQLWMSPGAGRWQVLLERPGAAPDLSKPFDLGTVASSVTVTLPLPTQVPLVRYRAVRGEDGEPLVGATVTPWFEVGDDAAFFAGTPLRTNADGEVAVPLFDAAGRRGQRAPTWWVETSDRAASLGMLDLRDAMEDVQEIKVFRTASVEGRAYGRNGEPATGCHVVAGRKGRRRRTTVGLDGAYRLDGVPAGGGRFGPSKVQMMLVEDLANLHIQMASAEVHPGEVAIYHFGKPASEAAYAIMQGRVTAGGVPLVGALVGCRKPGSKDNMVLGNTDANGRFRLEGIEPGERRFMLLLGDFRVSDDCGVETDGRVEVAAGQTLTYEFDLPGGRLDVVILDAETGKPIQGAAAFVRLQDRKVDREMFPGFETDLGWAEFAGKDGVVPMHALPRNAPLQVLYRAPGYEEGKRVGVHAGPVDDVPRLEVRLTKQ